MSDENKVDAAATEGCAAVDGSAGYYCPDHKYNPAENSGLCFCPWCEFPEEMAGSPEFRLLEPGERYEVGDECWHDGRWIEIADFFAGGRHEEWCATTRRRAPQSR